MDVSIQAGSQAAAAEASRTKNLKKPLLPVLLVISLNGLITPPMVIWPR